MNVDPWNVARQPWLVGTDVTLADFSVVSPLVYAKEAEFPLAPDRVAVCRNLHDGVA